MKINFDSSLIDIECGHKGATHSLGSPFNLLKPFIARTLYHSSLLLFPLDTQFLSPKFCCFFYVFWINKQSAIFYFKLIIFLMDGGGSFEGSWGCLVEINIIL